MSVSDGISAPNVPQATIVTLRIDGRAREWLDAGSFFDWVAPEPAPRGLELKIFHAEFGDPGAPVLALLHGFPTSSIDWYDVVGPLSEDHRVCVLDFPGFGFSDKPKDASYTLDRDRALVDHYLCEVLGARAGAVVAHDRGDSVALAFAARCAAGESPFELRRLVLSNGNMFLPLSNLTMFQRLVLDHDSAPQVLEALTPEVPAAGLGEHTFTPPRSLEDPAIAALAQTFAANDGVAVIHDTIQYLVERSQNERGWLEALARSPVPTTLVWGLYDTVSPLRVAAHVWQAYLSTSLGENEFWLLPRANHYLQHDQAHEFVEVVAAALSRRSPTVPGPVSPAPRAPILIDRSRASMPSAKEVLAGG
jgi:pimeloyl-ACP methyl ester carboxylesterase